jgi:hypothetical protein
MPPAPAGEGIDVRFMLRAEEKCGAVFRRVPL